MQVSTRRPAHPVGLAVLPHTLAAAPDGTSSQGGLVGIPAPSGGDISSHKDAEPPRGCHRPPLSAPPEFATAPASQDQTLFPPAPRSLLPAHLRPRSFESTIANLARGPLQLLSDDELRQHVAVLSNALTISREPHRSYPDHVIWDLESRLSQYHSETQRREPHQPNERPKSLVLFPADVHLRPSFGSNTHLAPIQSTESSLTASGETSTSLDFDLDRVLQSLSLVSSSLSSSGTCPDPDPPSDVPPAPNNLLFGNAAIRTLEPALPLPPPSSSPKSPPRNPSRPEMLDGILAVFQTHDHYRAASGAQQRDPTTTQTQTHAQPHPAHSTSSTLQPRMTHSRSYSADVFRESLIYPPLVAPPTLSLSSSPLLSGSLKSRSTSAPNLWELANANAAATSRPSPNQDRDPDDDHSPTTPRPRSILKRNLGAPFRPHYHRSPRRVVIAIPSSSTDSSSSSTKWSVSAAGGDVKVNTAHVEDKVKVKESTRVVPMPLDKDKDRVLDDIVPVYEVNFVLRNSLEITVGDGGDGAPTVHVVDLGGNTVRTSGADVFIEPNVPNSGGVVQTQVIKSPERSPEDARQNRVTIQSGQKFKLALPAPVPAPAPAPATISAHRPISPSSTKESRDDTSDHSSEWEVESDETHVHSAVAMDTTRPGRSDQPARSPSRSPLPPPPATIVGAPAARFRDARDTDVSGGRPRSSERGGDKDRRLSWGDGDTKGLLKRMGGSPVQPLLAVQEESN